MGYVKCSQMSGDRDTKCAAKIKKPNENGSTNCVLYLAVQHFGGSMKVAAIDHSARTPNRIQCPCERAQSSEHKS